MKIRKAKYVRKNGFTLIEVLVASSIAVLVSAGIYSVFISELKGMRSGSNQALFIARARGAEQRISRTVRQSKYFEIPNAWTLYLYDPENERTIIEYADLDDNPETLEDNVLLCTPPDGDPFPICAYVSPISADTDLFSIVPTTPKSIQVCIHVGDDLNAENDNKKTGRGYQGVEMRFSATPRNIQYWYD